MSSQYNELLQPIDGGPHWWAGLKQFPSKIMDQHFGKELFPGDLKGPFTPGYSLSRSEKYIDDSGFSSVSFDSDTFGIQFQSEQFLAKDLNVIFREDSVTISGFHSLKKEGDGQSYRAFERRYIVPIDFESYNEELSADGHLLTIKLTRTYPGAKPEANVKN